MKTIIVSGYGVRLRFRKGVLKIESGEECREIPLANIDQVVVATSGVWFSSKLIRKLIEYGVDIVILDSRGYPIGRVYPPYINKTVETRRHQYKAYGGEKALHIIKELAYSKIVNQAAVLRRYYSYTKDQVLKDSCEQLHSLASSARNINASFEEAREALRLIEAEAARVYWASYSTLLPSDLKFPGRDHDSQDPVNMSLNYLYSILYGECWKALVLAGLDPYAGFMHVDRSGKTSLVYDFVEQFRFIAELLLLAMLKHGWRPSISNGLLDYKSRVEMIKKINEFMDSTKAKYIDEAPQTIRQVIKRSAFALSSHLRGDGVFKGYIHR
ncbi:MAG: CRISPR-associated endonuclease Cas1 [Desulfurococcaceae archaeon]